MATIRQVYKNIHAVKFDKVVEDTLRSEEDAIIKLNANQLQDGQGSDDKELKNRDKKYTGVYKPLTQEIAESDNPLLPKRAGELYNFVWTGDFLANLQLEVKKSNIQIYSTGTGSGSKADFFRGYTNLYGLNKKSREDLIDEYGFKKSLVTNYKKAAKLI
jgi:hypothetical protein